MGSTMPQLPATAALIPASSNTTTISKPLLTTGAISEVEVLRLEREVSRFRGDVEQTGAQIANNAVTGLGNQQNLLTGATSLGNNQFQLPMDVLNKLASYMQLGQSASGISGNLGQMGFNQTAQGIGGGLSAANSLLRSAFEAKPDAEIAAHWGEVLWAMGQRDAAQQTWERGLQLNPENETLRDTVRRLTQKP
jgi:tetratricopeptide (TPR) repeat protein